MIIGVGLSRTGTTSLNEALRTLGIKSIHYQPHLLEDALWGRDQNFRVYDHVEAVTDLPAAHFYREISTAYPNSKLILTIREENSWFQSVSHHYRTIEDRINLLQTTEETKNWLKKTSRQIRKVVYGSEKVTKEYIEKYKTHNESVNADLTMDITEGDGWEKLCNFLNKPIPNTPFPYKNKKFKQIKI